MDARKRHFRAGMAQAFAAAAGSCAVMMWAAPRHWGGLAHTAAAFAILAIPVFLFAGTRLVEPRKVSRYRSGPYPGMTLEPVIVGSENGRLVFGFPCMAVARVPRLTVPAGITLTYRRRRECARLAAPASKQNQSGRYVVSGKSRQGARNARVSFRLAGVERALS